MTFVVQAEQICRGSIDKTAGTLLYTIAAKLKAQIVEHRGLLTEYVSQRKIASDLQLTGKIWSLFYTIASVLWQLPSCSISCHSSVLNNWKIF